MSAADNPRVVVALGLLLTIVWIVGAVIAVAYSGKVQEVVECSTLIS